MTRYERQIANVSPDGCARPSAAQRRPERVDALALKLLPEAIRALDDLAPRMGLSPQADLLRFERTGFSRANAAGRVEGGRVVLHPDRFDPALPAGRALLAHELAHLFQQRLPAFDRDTAVAAEAEARSIAARVRDGRSFPRPVVPLALNRVLFDDSLGDLVRRRFAGEIARIRRLLRGWLGFLWVSDGAVREIFSLLEALDFASARAVFGTLTPDERETLMDNVSPSHFGRFRRLILAAFSVTGRATIARQDENLFEGMDFAGLDRDELSALHHVLTNGFPREALNRLLAREGQGRYLRQVLEAEGGLTALAGLAGDESLADYRDRREAEALERLREERQDRQQAIARARDDPDAAEARERLVSLLASPNDARRLEALDLLSTFLDRPTLFEGLVQSLQPPTQMEGALDRLLDDFPHRELVTASGAGAAGASGPRHRRIETLLRVAELRPPWKNTLLAERLLTSHFFNILTSSEAYMAFQLLRALPPEVRAGFLEEDEARTSRLYGSMSQSMREGAGLNFYRGGEGRLDLASIQSQLLDDALWDVAEIGRLTGLIRMAGAAGEAEWLFSRSREVAEAHPARYEDADFQARVVGPFMLFGSRTPGGQIRRDWEPAYGDWAVENIWQAIGAFFEGAGDIFQLLGDSRSGGQLVGNALFGRAIGGEGISAAAFQDLLGGSFMGIRFVAPEDRIEDPELAREIHEADEADRGVNYIDRAYWDTRRGVLELGARDLAIAAVRYPIGDVLVSAGRGRVRGLDLNLSYAARRAAGRSTNLSLAIEELTLDDMLVVFRDSMLAINRVAVSGFSVTLGRDAMGGERAEARTGVDPLAILNPLTPILRLIGLSGHIEDSSGEMVSALTEAADASPLVVNVAGLTLTGLQTSSGQYVETIDLANARVGIAGSVTDYLLILDDSIRANEEQRDRLRALIAGLPAWADRTGLEGRVALLTSRLSTLETLGDEIRAAQTTVSELQPRRERLSEADAERLRLATETLAPYREGGITFDAGRIRVSGAEGRVSLGDLDLTDVHGRGGGAPGLLAFLTDSEVLNRIARGPAHHPPLRRGAARGTAQFTLELGDIEIDELRVGAALPTLEDARRDFSRAQSALDERDWDPTLRAEVERTRTRLHRTERFRQLAAAGAAYLAPGEVEEMARLRSELLAEDALYVHRLEARQARLGFHAGRGTVTLGAESFTASGREAVSGRGGAAIRAGDISIGAAEGEHIDFGVGVTGGLHGFSRLSERLARLRISGDTLSLDQVTHAGSAASADRVAVDAFRFDLQVRDWALDAQAGRLHAEGVRQRITRSGLETRIRGLENRGARRTEAENELLDQLREALATLEGYAELFRELDRDIEQAGDDASRAELEQERSDAYTLFRVWERSVGARVFTLRGLHARISGDENLAATRFSLDRSLERGITVEGRGGGESTERGDRIFAGASITEASFGNAQAGSVEIGETAGGLTYGRRRISFDNLAVESIAVRHFHLTSHSTVEPDDGGGTAVVQIYSDGTSTLTGITATGSLDFEPVEGGDQEYRLAHVDIPEFSVERLTADGLGYFRHHHPPREGARDPDASYGRSEYRVESGTLRGIDIRDFSADIPESDDEHMRMSGDVTVAGLDNVRASAFIEGTLNESNVRLSSASISFQVESEGGVTRLSGIELPSVTLHSCHFRGQDGKSLRAPRAVRLSGIRADATIDRTDADSTVVILNGLHVTSISGEELTAVWPPYAVHVRQDERVTTEALLRGREAPPPLSIANLDVTGLRWSSRDGVTPAGDRRSASIDIDTVHAAFNVMTEDAEMNLDGVVDATEIDFDFLRGGRERLTIDDVDARFSGRAAPGITVDTEIRDLSTGEVSIEGRRISIPDLGIPTINVEELDYDSDDMRVQIPRYNARATLTGTTAALTVTRAPEDSEAPFERLEITELVVPQVTMRGVIVTLKDSVPNEEGSDDLVIAISPLHGASITNLRVTPRPGDPAFSVVPDPAGTDAREITGRVHFDRFDATEVSAEVGNLIGAEANVRATNLDFDFLASGGTSLSLEQLRLRDLAGNYGDHRFNMTTGRGNSTRHAATPEATIHGLQRGADGRVSIDSAALSGLVYERNDLGVRVDVLSAELPARSAGQALTYDKYGTLVVPEAIIRNAVFHVDDLSNMGGSGGAAGGPPVLEHMNFLDALSGTVSATIGIPYAPDDALTMEVRNGEIDLNAIENTLWTDLGVDFDFEEDRDRLVLNIDYGNLVAPVPAMIPQFNYEAVAFDLSGDEPGDAARRSEARRARARLSTLATRIEGGGSSGDPPISIYDISAMLSLASTRVDLRDIGGLLVSGDGDPATSDVEVTGALRPLGEGRSGLELRVNTLNAEVDPADPPTFTSDDGTTRVIESGELQISDIIDTRLDFRGFKTPGELNGRIREARITNLRVTQTGPEEDEP
ncbi:MAG: DUF4157 domain-containing protein [Halieaceae bacterium]|jgi:hypothetical protein|nr:DUF4157 domain-containing protein [Halieaceae bacterium]